MNRPVFSIITVALNEGSCLRGAIESVLAQEDCGGVEHIVVHSGAAESLKREFPHIKLVKEQSLSLSKGLNSGLALANGEIVAWLGEHDRYARGAFARVAHEIDRHPIVMGACGVCDERGVVISQIDNTPRSWFDTMKYWVAQAIPASSAVFFKRDLLAELRIEAEEAFDESLHFAMDFDLWLRLQEAHPFSLALPDILAYTPHSRMAPRGSDASARQTEMSRVFRRHASRRVQPEQNVSFVVPVAGASCDVRPLLEQLAAQTLPSLEVVVVAASGDAESSKDTLEVVRAQVARHRDIAVQCVSVEGGGCRTVASAYDAGVRSARSHIVACLAPSRKLSTTFAADIFRCFSKDEVGLLLPSLSAELSSQLFISKHGTEIFNPVGPFTMRADAHLECVVRKLAWLDSGGFSLHDRFPEFEFSLKRLMVMLAHKAWRVVHEELLEPLGSAHAADEAPFRLYENSVVVDEIARELRRNPFSVMRAKHGYGLTLPEDLWQAAQAVVQRMPQDANSTLTVLESDILRAVVEKNPNFGPALYCLADALERQGMRDEAERVRLRWREVHEEERRSPLYGA